MHPDFNTRLHHRRCLQPLQLLPHLLIRTPAVPPALSPSPLPACPSSLAPRVQRTPATPPPCPQLNTLERRLFFIPSFKIYGSVAGFYDYGPPGCAMKQNVTQTWRNHFILEENMLEVSGGVRVWLCGVCVWGCVVVVYSERLGCEWMKCKRRQ